MAYSYQKRSRMRGNPSFFLRALNIFGIGLAIACLLSAVGMVLLELVSVVRDK